MHTHQDSVALEYWELIERMNNNQLSVGYWFSRHSLWAGSLLHHIPPFVRHWQTATNQVRLVFWLEEGVKWKEAGLAKRMEKMISGNWFVYFSSESVGQTCQQMVPRSSECLWRGSWIHIYVCVFKPCLGMSIIEETFSLLS